MPTKATPNTVKFPLISPCLSLVTLVLVCFLFLFFSLLFFSFLFFHSVPFHIYPPLPFSHLLFTGTTIFHYLLSLDPLGYAPPLWQSALPTPVLTHDSSKRDPRIEKVSLMLLVLLVLLVLLMLLFVRPIGNFCQFLIFPSFSLFLFVFLCR